MGGGAWSASAYTASTTKKIKSGTTFAYSSAVASGAATGPHDTLDPQHLASGGPFAGKRVREARDSDDHPTSLPIAVGFDETGSMAHVPRLLQTKLAELFGLILRKGYVEHPQLLVGAYGDMELHYERGGRGEQASLQVGQFESDNRADETLDNIVLEANGGGNDGETVTGFWYFLGRYAELDSLDKRGKKGYLFTIGDEVPLPVLHKESIVNYVGEAPLEKDLTREEIVKLAQEKFEVYHVIVNNSAADYQNSINVYQKLLGKDHVIVLQDEEAAAEVIAIAIGLAEGTLDSVDDAMDDLDDVGASASTKATVTKALARFSGSGKGSVVSTTEVPADLATADAAPRL